MNKWIEKLTVRATAMIIAGGLVLVGAWMAHQGLRDDGYVDFHSAFVTGRFKTGSVGVLFAILGSLIALATVLQKPHPQRFKIRGKGVLIEWDGLVGHKVLEAQMHAIHETLRQSQADAMRQTDKKHRPPADTNGRTH